MNSLKYSLRHLSEDGISIQIKFLLVGSQFICLKQTWIQKWNNDYFACKRRKVMVSRWWCADLWCIIAHMHYACLCFVCMFSWIVHNSFNVSIKV